MPTRTPPTHDTDAIKRYTAEIASAGAARTVRASMSSLATALHESRAFDAAMSPDAGSDDPVTVFAELGVVSLSDEQRLQLAQDLISTVTERTPVRRERARVRARTSILDSFELLDSIEVARILAPMSNATRSVAQKRRKAGDLIGLPVGTRPDYRYPVFQLDSHRNCIVPLARYANRKLDAARDPYGAASWWLTSTELLDGNSPLNELEAGTLTETAIDNIHDYAAEGM